MRNPNNFEKKVKKNAPIPFLRTPYTIYNKVSEFYG